MTLVLFSHQSSHDSHVDTVDDRKLISAQMDCSAVAFCLYTLWTVTGHLLCLILMSQCEIGDGQLSVRLAKTCAVPSELKIYVSLIMMDLF
jgi:hypothetical protein